MYRNQDCKMLQGKSNLVIKIKTASGGERHQINQLVRIYTFSRSTDLILIRLIYDISDVLKLSFCKLTVNTKCKEIFTPLTGVLFLPQFINKQRC